MIDRDILTGKLNVDRLERFTFGKHKGQLISTVTITDPQYLHWLADTDGKYKISDTWRSYIEELAEQAKNTRYATYA